MKSKVNIIALVDVVRALSDQTLHNGNLSLVDDGSFDSKGQGTPELATVVAPGQVVQWTALAVDVQTPVAIKGITFLAGGDSSSGQGTRLEDDADLDLNVWAGAVPAWLTRGVPYRYRLEFQMHEGPHSVLQVDSPALISL